MKILMTSAAVALLSGLGVGVASAVVPMACDTDGDSFISAEEARTCTEQRFEEVGAEEEGLTQQQFGEAFPEADFTQVDQDGDGKISRDEWMKWHEQGFTAATEASEGRMPAVDYESMEWVKGTYVRQMPTDKAGQNKQ
jgi:EF hand domain-containing protein